MTAPAYRRQAIRSRIGPSKTFARRLKAHVEGIVAHCRWRIGSGIVESTIKQLGKRLKGSEKHWGLPGAEATLQVMSHLLSEDGSWTSFWKRCPLAA